MTRWRRRWQSRLLMLWLVWPRRRRREPGPEW